MTVRWVEPTTGGGAHLVLLRRQVVAHVARGHHDADGVLRRVERAPRVGDAVQVERARGVLVGAAREVLAHVRLRGRLEGRPAAALVEGDLGAQTRPLVRLGVGVDLLVRDVHALDALQLLEVAPALRVALVVAHRQREAQALSVGEVDVAVAGVVVAVVDVEEDGPLRRVEYRVRVLGELEWEARLLERARRVRGHVEVHLPAARAHARGARCMAARAPRAVLRGASVLRGGRDGRGLVLVVLVHDRDEKELVEEEEPVATWKQRVVRRPQVV